MNRLPLPLRLPRFLAPLLAAPLLAAAPPTQVDIDWVQPTAGVAVAVDASDSTFTALGDMALGSEMTVTRHDVDGNLLWQASIDQTDPTRWESPGWVAVDGQGDVIVSGTSMSGFSNPVEAASLLLKFSSDGLPLFRIVYESDFDGSSTRRCLVDEQDDIYVLGLGSGPAGFVAKVKKFAADGTPLWTWFDDAGIGAPTIFKFTPDGGILIAARSFFGAINGYAKIDLDGNTIWASPGIASPTAGDAAGDSSGNSYLIWTGPGLSGGTVVRKLDAAGGTLWQNGYPTTGARVEVGSDDLPVVAGFPDPGTAGAAFFKVDASGALLWSNPDADGPLGLLLHAQLVLDSDGSAYLAAGTLFEMAVCKVDAAGNSVWTALMPGGYARGMALGNLPGTVFVVGGRTARLVESGSATIYTYCSAAPNSSGSGARMGWSGSASVTASDLTLQTVGSVPFSPGLFYYGPSQLQVPFGDGFRCVGAGALGTFRLGPAQAADALGRASRLLDLTAPPAGSGPGAITPGSTFRFQWWYRDVAAAASGFNLSDGLSVTFQP